jgi:hypothetical protein
MALEMKFLKNFTKTTEFLSIFLQRKSLEKLRPRYLGGYASCRASSTTSS